MSEEFASKCVVVFTWVMVILYAFGIAWGIRLRFTAKRRYPKPCVTCWGDKQICNSCLKPGKLCNCPDSWLPTSQPCPECTDAPHD